MPSPQTPQCSGEGGELTNDESAVAPTNQERKSAMPSLLRVDALKGFLRWIENSHSTKNNISHNT